MQNALHYARETVRNVRWLEVNEIRSHVIDGEIEHWQVGVKIGFTLESREAPETLTEKKKEMQAEEDVTKAIGGEALH